MRPIRIVLAITLALTTSLPLQAQTRHNLTHNTPIKGATDQLIYHYSNPVFRSQSKQIPTVAPATDQIPMVQIGTTVAPLYNSMAGGDSDQDGLFEIAMYIKDNVGGWTYTYRIYENDGTNIYNQVFHGSEGNIPYVYGDTDGDSLMEFIGQNGFFVDVYESPAPGQLASQLIWTSPSMTNVVSYTTIGDLDSDGHMEIIHTPNSFGSNNHLTIFECIGNNQYQQIYDQWHSDFPCGYKAVADFDGDGLQELAFSNLNGDVLVYESTGNNSLQVTFRDNMNTANAYACCYADDMDGNGRPEFACGGSSSGQGWVTRIYEAAGNDSFIVRQEIIIVDGYFGSPGNAAGDVDGDGIDELIIQVAQALHIYKWNGSAWVCEETIPENFGSILHGVFCYDTNNNGYDDIIWLGIGDSGYWTNETILLECENAQTPPDVTVTLTPESPPIEIPVSGGSFDFNIRVDYNESPPQPFDGWYMIQYPDSSWHGPVMDPLYLLPLAPGTYFELDTTYIVEAGLDTGQYVFEARIGCYPDTIWDTDNFTFQIIPESSVENIAASNTPKEFALHGNYPNPFNPTTIITFDLPLASRATLSVYNILGRQIDILANGWHTAGTHQITFDGSNLPSGIYFYELSSGNHHAVRKAILLK